MRVRPGVASADAQMRFGVFAELGILKQQFLELLCCRGQRIAQRARVDAVEASNCCLETVAAGWDTYRSRALIRRTMCWFWLGSLGPRWKALDIVCSGAPLQCLHCCQ